MEISEKINNAENFFFDLDKTVWNRDSLTLGSEDLVHRLKQSGKNVYFHTDNTLFTREELARKLSSMGIKTEKEQIFNVGYALGRYLSENMVNKAYVIGETGLMDELEETGIEITENAETVIVGLDRQFNYDKMRRAFEIMENGGRMYICSTENSFNTGNSEKPHQGSYNSVFDNFENVETAGKPGDIFVEQFKDYFNYNRMNSIFIGDRLADIETGNRLGMSTGAVMSGNLTKPRIAKAGKRQKPDFGIPSLHKLRRRII